MVLLRMVCNMTKFIYEIWHIGPKWEYPLLEFISVLNTVRRNEVININKQVVQDACDRLNILACEDELYDIRTLTREEHENICGTRFVRKITV